jgi:hypothetical protein
LQLLLFVEELLESVCENDVGVVESAVLLVELVVLINVLLSRAYLVHYLRVNQ